MADTYVTPQYITAETLRVAVNKSAFLGMVNTQYNDEFAKRGAKVGNTINVRLPNSYTVRNGPVVNLQDTVEKTVPLTIQPEFGIDMDFPDYDMILTVDRFKERHIDPAGKQLASELDTRLAGMFKQVANLVGTPGSPPTDNPSMQDLWLAAGEKLDNASAPMDEDRFAVLGPRSNRNTVKFLNQGFNNQGLIGAQYRNGEMGEALGFNFMKSQNAPTFITGAGGGTPLVNGGAQGTASTGITDNPRGTNGVTVMSTKGWTASTLVLKAGDVITFGGVYDVNPQTKATLPYLKDFVVVSDVSSTAGNLGSVTVSPALISGGAYKNVSALPADNAPIVINHGATANTQYDQSLAFHKDAFTFVTVDMDLPKGMDMAERYEYGGVSVRFLRGFDIINNRYISRLDVLAGFACLRPDWATRVFMA